MAAVEVLESVEFAGSGSVPLRLVAVPEERESLRRGPTIVRRRGVRQRRRQRCRRMSAGLVLAAAVTVLCVPGHVFGATTGAGLSGDLANSSVLASGMDYVVQPGDTVQLIAREMNPVDPSIARSLLVHELHSSVVVRGEHVLIP